MRVYEVNVVLGSGSTGRIVEGICRALEEAGHEYRAAYGRRTVPVHLNGFLTENKIGQVFHAVMTRVTDRHGFYSKAATRRLIRDMKNFRPDVVHLHVIHGYYIHMGLLFDYLCRTKVPVVWTFHDCWAFTGHCAHYTVAGCGRWKEGCHHCPQKRSYPGSLLADASRENYEDKKRLFLRLPALKIVVPSRWLCGEVKKSFFKDCEVEVLPGGIDSDGFRPIENTEKYREKYGITGKYTVLGVAGRWTGGKGLEDFFRMRALLPEEFTIVLVGVDAGQRKSLPNGIIGIERTDSVDELAGLYSLADVYVNASLEETQGMTTLESLACGTPAAVYDSTAVGEVLSPETGRLVKAGDVERLACVAAELARKPPAAEVCRARALLYDGREQSRRYAELLAAFGSRRRTGIEGK